jgi:hypothetical protein
MDIDGAPSQPLPATDKPTTDLLDLVTIITKIRGLQYTTAQQYMGDVERLGQQMARAVADGGGKDISLVEAAETLIGNGKCFVAVACRDT